MPVPGFSAARLSRIAEIERWHSWFVGRRALLLKLLARHAPGADHPVLDIGCGTGHMLEVLEDRGYKVVGLDLRPEGLRATKHSRPAASLSLAAATHLPFPDNHFGAVMLLDVLEHTDDTAAAREAQRVLRPGGYAFVSVPALPFLWSFRDEAAGHLRRYTKGRLLQVFSEAELRVQDVRYFQCLLLPLLVASRLLGRSGPATRDLEDRSLPILNGVFTSINKIEVLLGDVVRWPWGSSLVVVCRKE